MKIRLRFFASLRERLRKSEAEHELENGSTVADLWNALCEEHPELREVTASISFAVNQEYVDRDTILHDGDEVALIPPVSGG
jgi:molybdopterin converting factor subunit 1